MLWYRICIDNLSLAHHGRPKTCDMHSNARAGGAAHAPTPLHATPHPPAPENNTGVATQARTPRPLPSTPSARDAPDAPFHPMMHHPTPLHAQHAFSRNITYVTGQELGFAYLRDNTAPSAHDLVRACLFLLRSQTRMNEV